MWFLFISFVTQTKFPKIHCSAQSARLFSTIYIVSLCEKQHLSNEFYSLKNIGHKLISVQRNWMKYRCLRLAVAIYCTRLCIIFACVVCQQVINVISKSQFFLYFSSSTFMVGTIFTSSRAFCVQNEQATLKELDFDCQILGSMLFHLELKQSKSSESDYQTLCAL